MPHDPARVAETRAWFLRARDDLRAGDLDLTPWSPLCGDAAFHAQQAAEKCLKGYLCWHLRQVRKTHDLSAIGKECIALSPRLEPMIRNVAALSQYAWRFRYLGEDADPGVDEVRDALQRAATLMRTVLEDLPAEVAP
jgi:HEPN domain-containing protein